MRIQKHIGTLAAALLGIAVVSGCNREPAASAPARTDANATAPAAADNSRARQEDITKLNERVQQLDRKYAEANQKVTSGTRTATAGLREEVKEDVTNVQKAVNDLSTTTPQNWWERHEQAMQRTADDIEADVRRMSGKTVTVAPVATTGTTEANVSDAPFTSRRDRFVKTLRGRIEAMEDSLKNVKAKGTKDTELDDTRARLKKLGDDLDRLDSASADDWWDISKARVTEYVERVEDSVGRLDDNKR